MLLARAIICFLETQSYISTRGIEKSIFQTFDLLLSHELKTKKTAIKKNYLKKKNESY